MRNKILLAMTAAFSLSCVGSAFAAPAFPDVKKADEKAKPDDAVNALAKTEAKDAKKNAKVAKKKAKTAEHKADTAAKDAEKAAKAP
jgi:hypothetical protein